MIRCLWRRWKLAKVRKARALKCVGREYRKAREAAWYAYENMAPCREKMEVLSFLTIKSHRLCLQSYQHLQKMAECFPKPKGGA